jgi:hypothetical protein
MKQMPCAPGAPPPHQFSGYSQAKPVKTSWVAWVILFALLIASPASAHGGGKQQLAGEAAGPYRLYVWTSPDPWRVGEAHTTVAVTRLLPGGEETPATGLQVFVTYVQGEQSRRIAAVEQTGAQAGYYEADNAVAAAGDWQVLVAVSGAEGEGRASFAEAVLPANSFNWWLIGGGVLLALLLLGYLGTRRAGPKPVQRGASL